MAQGESYTQHMDPNLSGPNRAMEYNATGLPALRVIANPDAWGIMVANGDIEGTSHIEKFGLNLLVGISNETIWDAGTSSPLYQYPAVGEPTQVQLTSTSVEDSPTGDGARTIRIEGLDANYDEISEILSTGETTTVGYIRIFRMVVVVSGVSGVNEGTINATCITSGNVLGQIGVDGTGPTAAGRGQTFMALYTIPAGKTGYITQWTLGSGKQNADVVGMLMTRDPNEPDDGSWNARDVITAAATTYAKSYKVPIKVNAGDDIEVRGRTSVAAGSVVSSTFNILLIDNPVAP